MSESTGAAEGCLHCFHVTSTMHFAATRAKRIDEVCCHCGGTRTRDEMPAFSGGMIGGWSQPKHGPHAPPTTGPTFGVSR